MKRFSTNKMLIAGIPIAVLAISFGILISIRHSQRLKANLRPDHSGKVFYHIQQIITAAAGNEDPGAVPGIELQYTGKLISIFQRLDKTAGFEGTTIVHYKTVIN